MPLFPEIGRWAGAAVALSLIAVCCAAPVMEMGHEDYSWAEPRPTVDGWLHQHGVYVAEAEEARKSGLGFELLFYGDSITECWRGTGIGKPSPGNCRGTPDVYERHWRAHYSCDVFAVGADKTSHQMWRLLHGESPVGLHTKAAVLLIGTNDLGYAAEGGPAAIAQVVNSTIMHIKAIASYIIRADPDIQVILQGVLPRGDWDFAPPKKYSQPSKYTAAIDTINDAIKDWAARQGRVHFVYCGDAYLDGGGDIVGDLMPDALHPNAAGMDLMAKCLEPWVQKLVGPGHPRPPTLSSDSIPFGTSPSIVFFSAIPSPLRPVALAAAGASQRVKAWAEGIAAAGQGVWFRVVARVEGIAAAGQARLDDWLDWLMLQRRLALP